MVDGTKTRPGGAGDELNKWLKDDAKVQELLVTRMEEGPLIHLLSCEIASDMWSKLKTIYDKESAVSVHLLQQKFFMLSFDTSVSMFISKIEEIKNKLRTAGETLSDKMVITKILMSLPDQYKHFRSAWESVPVDTQTLEELTSRLLLEEERCISAEKTVALTARTSFQKKQTRLTCHVCNKVGHVARSCFFRNKINKNSNDEKDESQEKQKTLKVCKFCKKPGHLIESCWIKNKNKDTNQRNDKEKENESNAFMVFGNKIKTNDWCLDSGASEHMSWNKNLFDKIYKMTTNKMVQVGNGEKLDVKGYGNIKIWAYNGEKLIETTLTNVLYVPKIKYNLFSASCALDKGYFISSDNLTCQIFDKNGKVRAQAVRQKKLYTMIFTTEYKTNFSAQICCEPQNINNCTQGNDIDMTDDSILDCMKVKSIDTLKEWHRKLAHQNMEYIKEYLRNKNIEYIDNEKDFVCEQCLSGKQHKIRFKNSESRATQPLEIVHADVCGPMETTSFGGSRYFLLLKDDFSSYRHVYFMQKKSEVKRNIEKFISMAERQTGYKIKILRTDNGLEFCNKGVTEILEDRGICHQRSVVYTPQQNGRAERENRILVEAARTMLYSQDRLSKIFWAEAINTAAYNLNRTGPSPQKGRTPYELWHNKENTLTDFKIFGNRVSIHVPKENRLKWDAKNIQGIFIGYGENIKGFRVYIPDKNKVETLRDVIFLPEKSKEMEKQSQKEEIYEVIYDSDTEEIQNEIDNEEEDEIDRESSGSSMYNDAEENSDINDEIVNERYNLRRDRKPNTKYDDYEMDVDKILIATSDESDEPLCYDDAMASSDAKRWRQAMEAEIKA